MNYAVVSSCSGRGWVDYGARFVDSFLRFWPQSIDLILCSEDDLRDAAKHHAYAPNFTLIDLRPAVSGFLQRFGSDPIMNGRQQLPGQRGWTPKKLANGYNFRYDAARFGLKAFSIAAAAERVGRGKLYWADADIVTFAPVTRALLTETLPDAFALSCLDRGADYHSECGWVGYDLNHEQTKPFILAFRDLYESGSVRELAEWHDSWVFDWLRRQRQVSTYHIPHKSRKHPFANSCLSKAMDHCKGDRKRLGKTPSAEVAACYRQHEYWRTA